jgi:hypothetical protein
MGGIDAYREKEDAYRQAMYSDSDIKKQDYTASKNKVEDAWKDILIPKTEIITKSRSWWSKIVSTWTETTLIAPEMPKTISEFNKLRDSIDKTAEGGAEAYAALTELGPEFANMVKYVEEMAAAQRALDESSVSRQLKVKGLTDQAAIYDMDVAHTTELKTAKDALLDTTQLEIAQNLEKGLLIKEIYDRMLALNDVFHSITGSTDNMSDALIKALGGSESALSKINRFYADFAKEITGGATVVEVSGINMKKAFDRITRTQTETHLESYSYGSAFNKKRGMREVTTESQIDWTGAIPQTRQAFVDLVNGSLGDPALFNQLMDMEPLVNKYFDDLEADIAARLNKQLDITKTNSNKAMAILEKAIDKQKTLNQEKYDAEIKGIDAAKQASSDSIAAQKEANAEAFRIQEQAQQDYVSKVSKIAGTLRSTLDGMKAPAGDTLASRGAAQADLTAWVASGNIPLNGELDKSLQAIAQPSEQLFSTFVDYQRDYAKTAIDLTTLSTRADGQLTTAEASLKALQDANTASQKAFEAQATASQVAFEAQATQAKAQLDSDNAALEKTLAIEKEKFDIMNGTLVATMSIVDALDNLAIAMGAQASAQEAVNKNDTKIAALSEIGRTQLAMDVYQKAGRNDLYDSANIHLTTSIQAAISLGISSALANSDLRSSWDGITGGSMGNPNAWNPYAAGMQSYAVGTDFVPYDMTANIHQGEIIMDRASSDVLRKYGIPQNGAADNREVVAELKELRAELAQLRAQTGQIAVSNKKIAEYAEKDDVIGTPAVRTA